MKRLALMLIVGVVVFSSFAPAVAELCEKCKNKVYTCDIGRCENCGGPTASGAFKLCRKCSALLGECQHCRAKLKAVKPPKNAKPVPVKPAPKPAKIDTKKSATYTFGKWKYEHVVTYSGAGTNLKSRSGKLTYDGKPVTDNLKEWDRIKTPWGMMIYVPGTNVIGWAPIDSVHALSGRLLPSPVGCRRAEYYYPPEGQLDDRLFVGDR